jgi:hypothetical protein
VERASTFFVIMTMVSLFSIFMLVFLIMHILIEDLFLSSKSKKQK